MALKLSYPAIDIHAETHQHKHENPLVRYVAPLARFFFSFIFLVSSVNLFSIAAVEYARGQGVPNPGLLVPLSGTLALVGGISVLVGYRARIGALLLILFLLPVTFAMHDFWNIADPQLSQIEQIHFLKNLSMLGGALMILYFGAGPVSMDSRNKLRGPS